MHIGLEGRADRFNDRGAGPVVRLRPELAERAQPGEVTDQLLLGQDTGDVHRLNVYIGPTAVMQDAAGPVAIREAEWPWRARSPRRNGGQECCRGTLRGCAG